MQIIWKDSRTYKTYQYRNHTIRKTPEGWVTDIPGDQYYYYSAETAHNAVDEMLGGKTRKANPIRHSLGVKIVGRKGGDNSCA